MQKKVKKSVPKTRKFSSLKTQVADIDKDVKNRRPIAVRTLRDGQRLLRRLILLRQKGEIDGELVSDMCKLLDRHIVFCKEIDFNEELDRLRLQLEESKNANDKTDSGTGQTETFSNSQNTGSEAGILD